MEPSAITIPSTQTDKQGLFSLSGLKAPGAGSYEIVAHFSGTSLLNPSDSPPVTLQVQKRGTSLSLEIKANPSSASLTGKLIDSYSGKGISNQIISFTADKSGLKIQDAITDSKGKYKTSVTPIECGIGVIKLQSDFSGNSVLKPSDSSPVGLKSPNCSKNSISSDSANSKASSSPLGDHYNETKND